MSRPGTIFAPATPPGRAALGVVRISGPKAAHCCAVLTGRDVPAPRQAALRRLRDGVGEAFDQALILWFPGPRSETGEDMLEIQHHGGEAVRATLLDILGGIEGLRPAEPGEFGRRAFLAGKLGLTAVEGLADLVDATTRAQARQALRQLEGGLERLYTSWRERTLQALARIEAEIDFAADEDVPEEMRARMLPDVTALQAEILAHLHDGHRGERLRSGITVAVIGPPNAGKSSLVNLLARRDAAIVTPFAGTTRDVIEVPLDLDGIPVTLLDTAGLRETGDPIEIEGIRRARHRAETADLTLGVLDCAMPDQDPFTNAPDILVANKCDLAPSRWPSALTFSCEEGIGLQELRAKLTEAAYGLASVGDAPLITRGRHRHELETASAALQRFCDGPAELVLMAEDLRTATQALGRITGAVSVEDVLDRIFAEFCIGK
ncbi:MAG: tRNA uridine-5-carboxymethylaminomethyl(34) synthesis GTPase MnmE [Geminicoccaceae bacterium]